MLDMGFIHDVRKIVAKVPSDRQTMLFSATLPDTVIRLASSMLKDPVRISVSPTIPVAANITQKILFVEKMHKNALLKDMLKTRAFHAPNTWPSVCPSSSPGTASRQIRSIPTRARTHGNGPWQTLIEGVSKSWWPPTSWPAALTWTGLPMLSIMSCPTKPKATYIESAERPARGQTALPYRSAIQMSLPCSAALKN